MLKSVGASWHPDKGVFHFSLHFLAMPTRSELIWNHIDDYPLRFLSNTQSFWFMLNTSYDHGCHLANQFHLDLEDYEVFLIITCLVLYMQLGITTGSTPRLWESSLVAEALAGARCHHEERLHNNQPEWMRGMREVQPEATAWWDSEAPADGRHRCDERQRNNQLDKIHKRGAMRGSGAMRGRGAGGREVAVWWEMTRQTARVDKRWAHQRRRGAQQVAAAWREVDRWRHHRMGGGGVTRSWGGRGQEATWQPAKADKRHESEDGDLAESEVTMA